MVFFFQAEDGIRDAQESRGLGDVYKRQVPALYTGRLEVVLMGGSTDCVLATNPATVDIIYYAKSKGSAIHTWSSYVNIPASTYSKGKILTEFHIPYRKLKEVTNGDKVFYVKIKINYTQSGSSGNLNAYLVWK